MKNYMRLFFFQIILFSTFVNAIMIVFSSNTHTIMSLLMAFTVGIMSHTTPLLKHLSQWIWMNSPVDSIVAIIVRAINPEKIILFGSRSGSHAGVDSDYDICVLKSGISHRRRCAMKLYEALAHVGVPVDIIVETPETYEELKKNHIGCIQRLKGQGEWSMNVLQLAESW